MPVDFNRGSFRNYGEGPYPIRVTEEDWPDAIARWQGRIAEDMPMERPSYTNNGVGRLWVNDCKTNASTR